MQAFAMSLPLGISRTQEKTDLDELHKVFGRFGFIDFNVARTSEVTYSIRIKRSNVLTARSGSIDIEETVGGLVDDRLRLTYGEFVEILGPDSPSSVRVRFTSNK